MDTKLPQHASNDSIETLSSMTTEKRSKAMRRLWDKMAEVYGAGRWEREYDAEPSEGWMHGLGHCTLADIARGIGKCERDDSGRLPTLGQFRALCREYQPGTFAGAAAPPREYPALPALADMCGKTNKGKQWHAFMKLEGMIPMGTSTMDDLDRDLGDADIDEMRRKVADVTPEIQRRAMRGAR